MPAKSKKQKYNIGKALRILLLMVDFRCVVIVLWELYHFEKLMLYLEAGKNNDEIDEVSKY